VELPLDPHTFADQDLAGPLVGLTIDIEDAFEAGTHQAEWTPACAVSGQPRPLETMGQQYAGNRHARGYLE